MRELLLSIIILLSTILQVHAAADDATIRILLTNGPGTRLPEADAKKVYSLNGKLMLGGKTYKGMLDVIEDSKGLYVVKTMPVDDYVRMVVEEEMGKDGGIEAMKSLAVVTRTYAIYNKWQNMGKLFHLIAELHEEHEDSENPDPYVNYAVRSTMGEVLTFEGIPINAVHHSTCEGMTELPEEVWGMSYPYLKSVACYSSNAPYEHWQRRYTRDDLEARLNLKGLRSVFVKTRTATGRAATISVLYFDSERGITEEVLSAREFIDLMGEKELPSTDFEIIQKGRYYLFNGRGRGHAVGLSRWGAIEMAWEGRSYREILSHFYPGADIQKREEFYTGRVRRKSAKQ